MEKSRVSYVISAHIHILKSPSITPSGEPRALLFILQREDKEGMDHLESPNPKFHNPKHLIISLTSHRIIKFLISISLFSALLSLLQSLKPLLMMLSESTIHIHRSYIFLLCNGLVMIILKNSGLLDAKIVMEMENPQPLEKCAMIAEEEKDGFSDTKEGAEEQGNYSLVIIDEDQNDEEDETEELNKKVEDFITKMKEAFCSEPRADYNFGALDNQNALMEVHWQ